MSSAAAKRFTTATASSSRCRSARRAASSAASASSSGTPHRSDPSPSSSARWSRPLPEGKNKAYDLALSVLGEHRSSILKQLEAARSQASSSSSPSPGLFAEIERLEIAADEHDPATRAEFASTQARGQMHRSVMRAMAKRVWEKDGGLDLIMGRIYQNRIVPDVLGDVYPTRPLTVQPAIKLDGVEPYEPGRKLPCRQFESAPSVRFQPFEHPEPIKQLEGEPPKALYTLLVVDPDEPDHQNHTFSPRLNYVKTDIPLGILDGDVDIVASETGKVLLSWEPPAPAEGSKVHRYVFLLVRQDGPSTISSIPRDNFDFRAFLASNQLTNRSVVGVNLFRCLWTSEEDEYIRKTWKLYRNRPAPVYERMPDTARRVKPQSAYGQRVERIKRQAKMEWLARQNLTTDGEIQAVMQEAQASSAPEGQ